MHIPGWRLRIAAAAIGIGGVLTAVPAMAATGPPAPGSEGPAGPPALMPNGQVATPPAPAPQAATASACPPVGYGPNYYAPGTGKTVALTFDDGPGASTASILSILAANNVPATFFNLGVNSAAQPQQVRSESSAGHVLGNHTWDHPDMTTLSATAQATEIDEATTEQVNLTGTYPCLFRPPGGSYNATTLTLAQQRRMAVWLWSVDTEDWKANGSSSSYWVDRIISLAEQQGGAQSHPVVLMHNQPAGNPATVLALPTIINYFRSQGYAFVTLSSTPSPAAGVTPGAAAVSATENDLFFTAADGSVWNTNPIGSSPSTMRPVGGVLVGAPAAIYEGSQLAVFGEGSDHALWYTTCPVFGAGACASWQPLGGYLTGKPGAAVVGPNATDYSVYAPGGDGALWVRDHTAAGWGSWHAVGGRLLAGTGAAAVGTNAGAAVAVVGTNRDLYLHVGAGSGFVDFGGQTASNPGITSVPDGTVTVFARGTDNAAWYRQGVLPLAPTGSWHSLAGRLTSGLTADAVAGGNSYLYGLGTDNQVYLNSGVFPAFTGWTKVTG